MNITLSNFEEAVTFHLWPIGIIFVKPTDRI